MTDVSTSNTYQSSSVSLDQLTQIFNSMTRARQPLPSTFAQDFLSQLEAAGINPANPVPADPTTEIQANTSIQRSARLPQYLLMPSTEIS